MFPRRSASDAPADSKASGKDKGAKVELTKGARAGEASTGPADSRPEGGPGKGRATPTRKEAEQRRKESVKTSAGGARAAARGARKQSAEEKAVRLEGIRRGDERYLPPRDKGPAKALARDVVDSRFNVGELFLPMGVLVLASFISGSRQATLTVTNIWTVLLIVIVVDLVVLSRRIRKELAARLPNERVRGLGGYAAMRAVTLRRMRTPKPRVQRGGKI